MLQLFMQVKISLFAANLLNILLQKQQLKIVIGYIGLFFLVKVISAIHLM